MPEGERLTHVNYVRARLRRGRAERERMTHSNRPMLQQIIFYRMTETADPDGSISGTSSTHLPLSNLERQLGSPPDTHDHLGSSTHLLRSCRASDLPPHSPHKTGSRIAPPAPPSHKEQIAPSTSTSHRGQYSYDEFYVMNDPPSYEEAMHMSVDLSSLQSLKHDDQGD